MYPPGTLRAEAITGRAQQYIATWVARDGLEAVARMTDTSVQTVAKALAGLPLMRCSRRRLLANYTETAA